MTLHILWETEEIWGIEELLSEVACLCAREEGLPQRVEAYLQMVDDGQIQSINLETRGVDRPTDVLSFPAVDMKRGTMRDNIPLLMRELDPETGNYVLGDVVISIDRARHQAGEYGHSLERELGYLTAHAMFHLMGYDHLAEEDRAKMRGMEEAVMARQDLKRGI